MSVRLIRFNPLLYPGVLGEIRRVGLRRFPCSVFHVVDDEVVSALSCLRQSREPKGWRQLLGEE